MVKYTFVKYSEHFISSHQSEFINNIIFIFSHSHDGNHAQQKGSCLFDRKLCIHTQILPLIPIFWSLFSNMTWSILSNSFGNLIR